MIAACVVFAAVFDGGVAARLVGQRTPCRKAIGRAITAPRCLIQARNLV